jgi:hypothetical protein
LRLVEHQVHIRRPRSTDTVMCRPSSADHVGGEAAAGRGAPRAECGGGK